MFQIPAIYLAKHYQKLTIIIEPVKALMQDQKEKLIKNGYTRVEAFNSDLISQVEKEAVLNRIKAGEVDLLYLSPETLLSYSIVKCTLCQGHYEFFLCRFLLYICLLCRGIKVMPLIDCFHLLL